MTKSREAIDPGEHNPNHPQSRPIIDRFLEKVEFREDGHWIWHGSRSRTYGQIGGSRRGPTGNPIPERAHSVAYRMFIGSIPSRHTLLTCAVPFCVNPDHVIPVPAMGGWRRDVVEAAPHLRREYHRARKRQVTLQQLANEYGVTREAIRLVVVGKTIGGAGNGGKGNGSKLSAADAADIRARYQRGPRIGELARRTGLTKHQVSNVVNCRAYRF